jgi:hypothetical protein
LAAGTRIAPNSEWPVFPRFESFSVTEFVPECRFDGQICREVIEWAFPTKRTAPSTATSIFCNVCLYHNGRKCEDLLVGEQHELANDTGGSFKVAIFADDLFRYGRRSITLFEFGCEFMIEFRICTRAFQFLQNVTFPQVASTRAKKRFTEEMLFVIQGVSSRI